MNLFCKTTTNILILLLITIFSKFFLLYKGQKFVVFFINNLYLFYSSDACTISKIILHKKITELWLWSIYVELNKIPILRHGDISGYGDINRKY